MGSENPMALAVREFTLSSLGRALADCSSDNIQMGTPKPPLRTPSKTHLFHRRLMHRAYNLQILLTNIPPLIRHEVWSKSIATLSEALRLLNDVQPINTCLRAATLLERATAYLGAQNLQDALRDCTEVLSLADRAEEYGVQIPRGTRFRAHSIRARAYISQNASPPKAKAELEKALQNIVGVDPDEVQAVRRKLAELSDPADTARRWRGNASHYEVGVRSG